MARQFAGERSPWTNVYGLARTLLAISTLLTLIANDASTLFIPLARVVTQAPFCDGHAAFGLFCQSDDLEAARWVAIVLLIIVASGWRPRITGALHWWVAASLQSSASLLDGGDQITMNLTLLLLPVTLFDGRKWHWSAPEPARSTTVGLLGRLVASFSFTAIRVQVMLVYYVAGVAKYGVEEWGEGTALYYWFSHPVFGVPAFLDEPIGLVTNSPTLLPLVTWGVMAFEALLAAALFMRSRHRRRVFVFAVAFHCGIALLHGILTFAIAMEAALILYLLPVHSTLGQLFARSSARPRGA